MRADICQNNITCFRAEVESVTVLICLRQKTVFSYSKNGNRIQIPDSAVFGGVQNPLVCIGDFFSDNVDFGYCD